MTVTTDNNADATEEKTAAADESASDDCESVSVRDTDGTDIEADEPDSAAEFDEERPRRSWRRRAFVGTLALLFLAALAVSGVLGWKAWQQRELTQASRQAQAAAVAYAQVLTSIDSNKVDETFNQVLDGATGEFKTCIHSPAVSFASC